MPLPRLASLRYKLLKAILDSGLGRGQQLRQEGSVEPNQLHEGTSAGPIATRTSRHREEGDCIMVDEETRRKLRELGMGEMVEALDLQESDGISRRWRSTTASG